MAFNAITVFSVVVLLISVNIIKRKMRSAVGLRVSSHLCENRKITMTYKCLATAAIIALANQRTGQS